MRLLELSCVVALETDQERSRWINQTWLAGNFGWSTIATGNLATSDASRSQRSERNIHPAAIIGPDNRAFPAADALRTVSNFTAVTFLPSFPFRYVSRKNRPQKWNSPSRDTRCWITNAFAPDLEPWERLLPYQRQRDAHLNPFSRSFSKRQTCFERTNYRFAWTNYFWFPL